MTLEELLLCFLDKGAKGNSEIKLNIPGRPALLELNKDDLGVPDMPGHPICYINIPDINKP